MSQTLILNDGANTQLVNNDYFLNAFRQANMSDPAGIAETLVNIFRQHASPEELQKLEEIAAQSTAQYLEG